jgi:aspartate aminotransferase
MSLFSPNVDWLEPSATIAVSSRVKQLIAEGRDVVDLCVGEPDFPTPAFIARAGIEAIREGRTRYTPSAGIPELRVAVAHDLARLSGLERRLDPRGVVISVGAKQALFNVCFSLFGPGDRVLVPVPYWTTYPALVRLARAEPVFVHGRPERNFKVTVEELDAAAEDGVRGLLLCSPSNPSGAVYSRDELEAIARWAAERGIWLVSDEIYRRIYFGGALAPGLLDLPEELLERAVVIDGASKAFAMTGWRIGFSYSSPWLAARMDALQSQTTSNVSTPTQHAALAAYRATGEADGAVEEMRAAFQRRRDLLVGLFRERLPDVRFSEPEGAFYLWVGIEGLGRPGEGSVAFCERVLQEVGVAMIPGAAFGDDSQVRISFAYTEDTLRRAVDRLAGALDGAAPGPPWLTHP